MMYKVMFDIKVYSSDVSDTLGKSHLIALEVEAADHDEAAGIVANALQHLVDSVQEGHLVVMQDEDASEGPSEDRSS